MDTSTNTTGVKEFEVTGVSRCGRVRKKSSKLLDFQSPDELDKKPKRTIKSSNRGVRGRPSMADSAWKRKSPEALGDVDDDMASDDNDDLKHDSVYLERDAQLETNCEDMTNIDDDLASEDDGEFELDELVADIVEGVDAENTDSKVRKSLYMTEKANKKRILKDGRVITGKLQRKDKGKTRFTAYSLWAREFRKSSKFSTKAELDFTNSNRRLSELWANVPISEKNIWRRKAKRLACKASQQESLDITNSASAVSSSLFLNRATTSRTRKLAEEKEKPSADDGQRTSKANVVAPMPYKRGRREPNEHGSIMSNASTTPVQQKKNLNNNNTNSSLTNSTFGSNKQINAKLPLSGIEPIDAAAHLKLLGESLSIIGERLKEHEGQITVSGSLSVLLDSLLCSLGPLLCLTTRLPGLEKRSELTENLTATLDNIAYVMPGL